MAKVKVMTVEEIQTEIDRAYKHWEEISKHGTSDPFWPDGVNMNLVRNHIIYYQRMMAERKNLGMQLSLFGEPQIEGERDLPPMVPEGYMAKGGKYFNERCQKLKQFSIPLVYELEGVSI